MRTCRFRQSFILAQLITLCVLAFPLAAQDRLAALVGDGSVMLRAPTGETLLSINPTRALVPASLLKIPLAQVALTTLGEDFRFETLFYRNDSDDLLIRGLGDPFLVSEEIATIADTLAQRGVGHIRRLVMDDSAFAPTLDLPIETGTDQPFGARNSALAVNFNTVNLAWNADGKLISGEAQTPLTAFAQELGASIAPGEPQRINVGDDPRAGLRQAQQLFGYFLENAGITVADTHFYQHPVTDDWTLIYRHRSSQMLRDTIDGLLRYSNNFIANQLFLALGAQASSYPVTTDTARAALQQQLTALYGSNFGQDPQSLLMFEGSGLSRAERSSAAGMMHILDAFKPYAALLSETNGVLRKSGTLTGVYNFAGYIRAADGLYPFVILTNQAVNNRAEILRILQQRVVK